jgi:transcriptional regulator of acetoin/glycerol metabolism
VRELRNSVEHAAVVAQGDQVDVMDLPIRMRPRRDVPPLVSSAGGPLVSLADAQLAHARHVLASVGGNRALAARILGIGRRTLYRMLERDRVP